MRFWMSIAFLFLLINSVKAFTERDGLAFRDTVLTATGYQGTYYMQKFSNCGNGTVYVGPEYGSCNATEATVQYTINQPMTMKSIVWSGDDGSCNVVVTVRKDGGDTALTCTATSVDSVDDSCQNSTDVAFDTGDLFSVELDEVSGCNNSEETSIIVTYTVP